MRDAMCRTILLLVLLTAGCATGNSSAGSSSAGGSSSMYQPYTLGPQPSPFARYD
jgi:hypothetical protein